MTNPKNKEDYAEILSRLTSTLKHVEACLDTFPNNPKYPQNQTGVSETLLKQHKALGEAAKSFLTQSHEVERRNTNRPGR